VLVHDSLTCHRHSENVPRLILGKTDSESAGRGVRLHQVAHHVHLGRLVQLGFAPEYWIVEQIEVIRVELALELNRFADVDDDLLVSSQQMDEGS